MAKPKVQMKISSAQYKALLERITSRNQATSQSSMDLMGADPGMMSQPMTPMMPQGMTPPTAPPQGMMGESGIPMPGPTPGVPMAPQVPDPTALPGMMAPQEPTGVGSLGSPQEAMMQVAQVWQELKGGVGEQLWRRLAEFADAKGAKNPEGFFIQEATKFMTNPASVKDERVRKFLTAILGESAPSQGGGDGAQVVASLLQ